MLTEENRLLRDYAYNVDPNAIIMHQHRFIQGHGYRTIEENMQNNANKTVLREKIEELS